MIGIHDHAGSFSDLWIEYCMQQGIAFRRLNCLATDVIKQCDGLQAVLWHWNQNSPEELMVARFIIDALEKKGLAVFPNMNTCIHFDDKVAQKYLLEAIDAPLIPTWVFTNLQEAQAWISKATWPKVFKLRCGAGSYNVKLVRTQAEAEALGRQAFGSGFPAVAGYLADTKTRLRRLKSKSEFWAKVKRAPMSLIKNLAMRKRMPRQRDYLYFQEFLPGNEFDTRITVVGNRAFGFLRMNRPGDFRASGSGRIVYDRERVDARCVKVAFEVAGKLKAQSLAFDFLFAPNGEPQIGEISYCYIPEAIHNSPGHWDPKGLWHEGQVWPQHAILEDLLLDLKARGGATSYKTC